MTHSQAAKKLGSLGGLARRQRLSRQRLEEIARLGAQARKESLALADAIRNNFDYVAAIHQLKPPKKVRSGSVGRGPLPGIYD